VSATAAPPSGAGAERLTVPVAGVPPVTEEGETDRAASEDVAVPVCGVKVRVAENGPKTPALFRARTRHQSCRAGRPLSTDWEVVTVGLATYGDDIEELSSTRTS
jgi:hypothetical protein